MFAIFKREVKAYFQTVTGWLFIAAVLVLYGLYFYAYNLRAGYPYISYSLSAIAFIMLIAVPVLTMRSFAEERHSRTDQLILTAPVSVGKVVLGKYLAMVAVLTVDIVIIAITPLLLMSYGTIPLGESYAAVFGFWLYGCACIAVGMFISSLTESQVISAVLTFVALFAGYMMGSICNLISESGNLLTKILGCYDLYSPLDKFMNGTLDVAGMVYYITIIALLLFLTGQSIQKRRWSISSKKISTGVFSTGMIIAMVALMVVVNLFVAELPTTWTSIDVTSTKIYSITDDTKDYLKNLDEDVTIYVLVSDASKDTTLDETLQRYESLSDHIKVSYINPAANPNFAAQYTDSSVTSNSMIVVSDARSRVIDYNDVYTYSYDYSSYSRSIDGYDAEGQLTSAIQYVTMEASELPVIYQVTGHGETALSGNFTEAIEKANITLSDLTLLKEDAIPKDAAALIINGPVNDFSEDDANKVIDYINQGGKVLITCNFQAEELANFDKILSACGMSRVSGVVMENDKSYYYGDTPYYLLPIVESASYTDSVANSYVFAPYSVGITYGEDTDDVTYTSLLDTTEKAVSKTDAANATTSAMEDGDIAGPFSLAAVYEKSTEDDENAKVVVFGSTEMFTDGADEVVSKNNSKLFTDTITELTGDSDLATSVIPTKEYTLGAITVDAAAGIMFGLCIMIVLPLGMIVAGIVIWSMRRKK